MYKCKDKMNISQGSSELLSLDLVTNGDKQDRWAYRQGGKFYKFYILPSGAELLRSRECYK